MEFMGFQRCMQYLLGCELLITTFISDRHTSIASHMRNALSEITHYFDIWHIKKSKSFTTFLYNSMFKSEGRRGGGLTSFTTYITLQLEIRKVLTKLAKLKGYEAISDWIKACENHLYWSATSTHDGNGSVIWAKFKAFLDHIVNKHSDLDEPLFNKCAHGEIGPKKWLVKGMVLFSGVASSIIGGAHIHIFMFTHRKNNRFQKKLPMQNMNI